MAAGLDPVRQQHHQVGAGRRVGVHVERDVDPGRQRLVQQAGRRLVHRQVRHVQPHAGRPRDLEALAASLPQPAPVAALVGRVDAAGIGYHPAQLDQLRGGGEGGRLVLQAGRHAHGAGVEPLAQVGDHRAHRWGEVGHDRRDLWKDRREWQREAWNARHDRHPWW